MSEVTLGGQPVHTSGDLPSAGSPAPDFTLTKGDLSPVSKADLAGQRVVLNIFPSIDTPTCAQSVRTFNARASEAANTVVVCISADLPFAQTRFCGAEGLSNVMVASDFRNKDFSDNYGVTLTDSVLAGLMARAVVVLDTDGTVLHSELVGEIANEPDYDAALAVLA